MRMSDFDPSLETRAPGGVRRAASFVYPICQTQPQELIRRKETSACTNYRMSRRGEEADEKFG